MHRLLSAVVDILNSDSKSLKKFIRLYLLNILILLACDQGSFKV